MDEHRERELLETMSGLAEILADRLPANRGEITKIVAAGEELLEVRMARLEEQIAGLRLLLGGLGAALGAVGGALAILAG